MDNAVALLLRPGTVALAVMVVIATFFIRRICELQWPSIRKKAAENDPKITYETRMAEWWNQVILYAIPPLTGALIGVAQTPFIFPVEDFTTASGRIIFGAVVGWFSSFLYKILRKMLKKTTGVELPSDSDRPSIGPESMRP